MTVENNIRSGGGHEYIKPVRGVDARCMDGNSDKQNKSYFKKMLEEYGLNKKEISELPPELEDQVEKYLEQVQKIESLRGKKVDSTESKRRLAMQYYLIREFVSSRNERVKEVNSPNIVSTQESIERRFNLVDPEKGTLLTNHGLPKSMLCVDGRLLSKLIGGFLGGAYHSPAGGNPEFRESAEDSSSMYLAEGSFTKMMDEHLRDHDGITEILDSHLACAAGCKNTTASHNYSLGKEPKNIVDLALYEDVLLKKQKATAIKDYVNQKYQGQKVADVLQISFDPHNGAFFMGLEKDSNLKRAEESGGYSPELLRELAEEGEVIDTRLIAEGVLHSMFSNHWFELDYVDRYVESTLEFTRQIEAMEEDALKKLKPVIVRTFPALAEVKNATELKKRAALVLANAYSHYLLTHDRNGEHQHYPFGEHRETFITVTRSEKGPYGEESFFVTPNSPEKLDDIELTRGLIKANREAGRMYRGEKGIVEKIYGKSAKDVYPEEPIPIVLFSRFESDIYEHPEILKKIQGADWSSLSDAKWIDMSEDEYRQFIDGLLNVEHKSLPMFVYEALSNMRNQAIELYKSSHVTSKNVRNGNLTPVWSLSDRERKTVALIPFIVKGFGSVRQPSRTAGGILH